MAQDINIELPTLTQNTGRYLDTGSPTITNSGGSLVTSEAVAKIEKTGGFKSKEGVIVVSDIAISTYNGALKELIVRYTSGDNNTVILWLECTNGRWFLFNSLIPNTKVFLPSRIFDKNENGTGKYRTDLAITMTSTAYHLLGSTIELGAAENALQSVFSEVQRISY